MMINKFFILMYNGIRFFKKKNYKKLLCVNVSMKYDVDRDANIIIGKRFRTRRNVELNVRDKATLVIGDQVFLNSGCIITVREKVSIGSNTIFGPNVMIFDHDHRIEDGKACDDKFDTSEVNIGSNVWIGAGTIILKGSRIDDNCIVAAGSVVKGHLDKNSIMIQKREKTIVSI